jgi:hypothetical protein
VRYKLSEHVRVRNQINQWILCENDASFSDRLRYLAEREEAFKTLLSHHRAASDTDPPSWDDAYFDSPIVAEEGRLLCSIETHQPLVWLNTKAREHIASNMLLTKIYANSLCGSNRSIALSMFHKLDTARVNEIAEYVLRVDHLHVIRSQIPWSEADRYATDFDEEFQAQYTQQWQTGVANLSACEKIADLDSITGPYLWRMKVDPAWLAKSSDNLPDLQAVRRFIEELEQDTGR